MKNVVRIDVLAAVTVIVSLATVSVQPVFLVQRVICRAQLVLGDQTATKSVTVQLTLRLAVTLRLVAFSYTTLFLSSCVTNVDRMCRPLI